MASWVLSANKDELVSQNLKFDFYCLTNFKNCNLGFYGADGSHGIGYGGHGSSG
jgi:hypothetical protein